MRKILDLLKSFFGLSREEKKIDDDFEDQLRELSSSKKVDEVSKMAFKSLLNQNDFNPNQPHPYEQEIRAECSQVSAAISNYYSQEINTKHGDIAYLLGVLDKDSANLTATLGHESVKTKLEVLIAQKNNEAEKLKKEEKQEEQALYNFRRAHGLDRPPIYIDRNNSLWILAAIALIEALVNGIFLRESTDIDVALIVALFFTALNIGGNVYLGFENRWANHDDPKKKKAGEARKYQAGALMIFVASILCWARTIIPQNENSVDFQWFLIETLALFLFSIALGIAAFIKGKALDDPFPGYSQVGKRLKEISERLQELRDEHAEAYDTLMREAENKVNTLVSTATNAKQSLSEQLPELRQLTEKWHLDDQRLRDAYENLIKAFKDIIINNGKNLKNVYPAEILNWTESKQLKAYEDRLKTVSDNQSQIVPKANLLISDLQKVNVGLAHWAQSKEGQALRNWP